MPSLSNVWTLALRQWVFEEFISFPSRKKLQHLGGYTLAINLTLTTLNAEVLQ